MTAAAKKPPTKVNPEALAIAAGINRKLGPGTVVVATQIRPDLLGRFTSGSVGLDVILGGGWPSNQWSEIVGEESHGKTALALKTIAANQARDKNFLTVWVAAEQWHQGYAVMCGVDTDRVLVVETSVMEDAFDAVLKFAGSRTVDCIVIDSLPALVPTSEDEKDSGEMSVGRGALLTGQFFRKVGKATKRSLIEQERPILGLLINQYRLKIGVTHGDPRTTSGGVGKNYAFYTRVEVRRDEWIEVGTKTSKTRIGQGLKMRTLKNKSAPPQQVAHVDFYFREGGPCRAGDFDFAKEILSLGILRGVVARKGAWYVYGEQQWQGAEKTMVAIRESVELTEQLTAEVLDSLKGGHLDIAVDEQDSA